MHNNDEQLSFLNEQPEADNSPVVCLGMTFENDEARREYFRKELREKLPELKQIEGFPIGEDEDIIALSDPPYYTACPNPWINDFIEEWEKEKVTKYERSINEEYHREPYIVNVSEGKYDKSYKFHPYPTKVPHKAIMRYILNYTKPGDIILDCFSGTGMTGVASKYVNNEDEIKALGYNIVNQKDVYEEDKYLSELGLRNVVLNDLSVAGSFISSNFNLSDTLKELKTIEDGLSEVEAKLGWMYTTIHSENPDIIDKGIQLISQNNDLEGISKNIKQSVLPIGKINFMVWSDEFICDECSAMINYWDTAVDIESGQINKDFHCPNCNKIQSKNSIQQSFKSEYDKYLKRNINQAEQQPKLINYTYNNKRYTKKLDSYDRALLSKIKQLDFNIYVPLDELPDGDETMRPKKLGISHLHRFYTDRNLIVLAEFFKSSNLRNANKVISRIATRITKMYGLTYQSGTWGAGGGPLSGTFYIPSLVKELNMITQLKKSFETQKSKIWSNNEKNVLQSIGSSSNLAYLKNESIDYIFIDPPFGGNLMYSELNYLFEGWMKVHTRNNEEAIINRYQEKDEKDYKKLMSLCLKEAYRVLKSGRWITVEFSNTKSNIWNIIQQVITDAGFIIANVSSLDKKKGSFKSITTTTAVKQDLVITAYKPLDENIKKMREEYNTADSAWTFLKQHLEKLPVFSGIKGEATIIAERTPRILFDRMVAYHVQHGLPVPISSAEFQSGVAQRFPMRDGMAFLESQVAEYDKKRTLVKEFSQMSLFVSDENSAIEWIRQQLMKKPQTRQDLHPQFMKEIQHIAKHEQLPELDSLLLQNFLRYEGDEVVPDQIMGYLRRNYPDLRGLENDDDKLKDKALNRWYVPDPNKQADLEKLREKSLLREFDSYVDELGTHKKKLKLFRTEAIRTGFKKAWSDKDYTKIVTVGDRLPESVIQEDDKLLMYYDNAQIRLDM
ncbi:DNA methyltransferase [Solibacillus silvestris]